LSRLREHKIIVRRAKAGEKLQTLDGNDHTLTADNLVIADGKHPVALAGVMGGKESEISSSTRDVLLESAWFDPVSIRRTSKSQGFHTEASHRFERGADIQMAPLALDRTAALIREIAGGDILAGMIDVYPRPPLVQSILFRRSQVARILGAEIPREEVERILRGLGFVAESSPSDAWVVTAPSFRVDISREVDLVEEVARHVGYDQLPSRVRPAPPRVEKDVTREKLLATTSLLVSLGFHEIITSSMVDPAEGEKFSASTPVVLENPLSQDASAMRASAVPSMLRAIRWNLDRDANDVKLFELGKTYSMGASQTPEEHRVLTLGSTGHRRAASVYDGEAALDFFDLKGEVEAILSAFELSDLKFEISGPPYLQPRQCGRFLVGEAELAVLGQIHSDIVRDYKLRQPVWVAEINFERLLEFPLRTKKFRAISKFPAVERDFSLIVPEAIDYAKISSAVAALGLSEIQGFYAADRFRGGSIPSGHYSLLLRVTFQSQARTLTGEEIESFSQRLLGALAQSGIKLRA
jgi:phenylalanyl-tRNA synthetase beta chain